MATIWTDLKMPCTVVVPLNIWQIGMYCAGGNVKEAYDRKPIQGDVLCATLINPWTGFESAYDAIRGDQPRHEQSVDTLICSRIINNLTRLNQIYHEALQMWLPSTKRWCQTIIGKDAINLPYRRAKEYLANLSIAPVRLSQ